MYIYIQNKANLYIFVDYSTFTVGENNLNGNHLGYYNCNSALEKEISLINGPNHVIHYMNRVQTVPIMVNYQCTFLKSILFNSSILDQYEIKLI